MKLKQKKVGGGGQTAHFGTRPQCGASKANARGTLGLPVFLQGASFATRRRLLSVVRLTSETSLEYKLGILVTLGGPDMSNHPNSTSLPLSQSLNSGCGGFRRPAPEMAACLLVSFKPTQKHILTFADLAVDTDLNGGIEEKP